MPVLYIDHLVMVAENACSLATNLENDLITPRTIFSRTPENDVQGYS